MTNGSTDIHKLLGTDVVSLHDEALGVRIHQVAELSVILHIIYIRQKHLQRVWVDRGYKLAKDGGTMFGSLVARIEPRFSLKFTQ